MKITLSPLVAALRGRAGGAVCAVTRGIQYVKKHGRPSGPPSQAQLEHRAHVARLANWWRSLPTEIRNFADVLAAENNTTGFALFSKACASKHSVEYDPTILPENDGFETILLIGAEPGMYPGDIDVDWDYGNNDPNHYLHVFYANMYTGDMTELQADAFIYHTGKGIILVAQNTRIENLRPSAPYWIVGIAAEKQNMPDDRVFSGGRVTASEAGPPL